MVVFDSDEYLNEIKREEDFDPTGSRLISHAGHVYLVNTVS